jgi:DNA-binding NarL/FixJ family response regulator
VVPGSQGNKQPRGGVRRRQPVTRQDDGERPLLVRLWAATPRQEEILQLLWSGLGDKEVADRLNIGDRTVRTHLEILRRRWRQRTRVGLLRVWQELKQEHRSEP